MAKEKNDIYRKLYYYDVAAFSLKEGDEKPEIIKNQAGIIRKAFKKIKEINDLVDNSESLEQRKEILKNIALATVNGDNIYILVDSIEKDKPIRFKLVLCRLNGFPYIEKNGILSNMTSEVNGEFNVAEVTHCVIFPDKGIMGAEYNFNGARPSSIVSYIPRVFPEIVSMSCHSKMRNDTFRRINEKDGYSLFKLGVKNTEEMRIALRDKMGLIGAFFDNVEDVDTYDICINRRKTKKKKGFEPPMTLTEIMDFVNNNREDISQFKICQGIYKDSIDLLSDKLICDKKFILTKNKVIDSNEVFKAIEEFYENTFTE